MEDASVSFDAQESTAGSPEDADSTPSTQVDQVDPDVWKHALSSRRRPAIPPRQNSPRRAYDLLRAGIRSGVIRNEQPLDEMTIAKGFATSRNSVRQALQMLAAEGLVTRQTRLGTSVTGQIASLPIVNVGIASVADAFADDGEVVTHEIIDLQFVPASRVIRDRLDMDDQEVLMIESVLSIDADPLYVSVGYIRNPSGSQSELLERVRNLYRAPHDLDSSMMLLYGKKFGHAQTTIEAVGCDARTARLLHVAEGAPMLFRDRVLFDEDGTPRDLSYTHLRGDRAALTADFYRGAI